MFHPGKIAQQRSWKRSNYVFLTDVRYVFLTDVHYVFLTDVHRIKKQHGKDACGRIERLTPHEETTLTRKLVA